MYKLLTPGPLTTTDTVKEEMLVDHCTWDDDYKSITQKIRKELLELAHVDESEYTAVLMQGSGTFGVESVVTSSVGKDDKILVCENGAYGARMAQLAKQAGKNVVVYHEEYSHVPDAKRVKEYLDADIKNSDLSEYVSQVLIPTEKVYQVRNGKKIVKERSYLPGYVLVEAALVGEVAHHLRNTPNVIGFLGGSENPVPLRQSEVNRILGTVDELQEGGEELNVPYTVGETVKVTVGPFSGFSGLIEEVNTEKRKLKVMVKIFGRKTPLELGFMDVEKE